MKIPLKKIKLQLNKHKLSDLGKRVGSLGIETE